MLKLGFKVAPRWVGWRDIEAIYVAGAKTGKFDSAWTNDHLDPDDGGTFEGWTAAALLAPLVPDLQFGHLVLANPFRQPAVLARMAVTLDHATRGRFVLAIGAGSWPPEVTAYGMALPPVTERLAGLEAALRIIRALFGRPLAAVGPESGDAIDPAEPIHLDAPPYRLAGARSLPPPLTPGGPQIWLGTQGERIGLGLVARYADGWNFSSEGGLEAFGRKRDALLRHCEAVGRDPAEIVVSAQMPVGEDPSASLAEARAYVAAGCEHLVLFLDPRSGPEGVRAAAEQIAGPLRQDFGG